MFTDGIKEAADIIQHTWLCYPYLFNVLFFWGQFRSFSCTVEKKLFFE